MPLPKHVTLVEVGARDGLQNEPKTISTAAKVEFINLLSQTGLTVIEATSFVSPKWVPQMADNSDVFQTINKQSGVKYPVLVPNEKGFEQALAASVTDIAVFIAASETFSQKNINCNIDESLKRAEHVAELAKANDIRVRGYVSCVLGCPYEGGVAVENVVRVATALKNIGCYEISLGDTIGRGTPIAAQHMLDSVSKQIPMQELAIHFHDTYGQALANIFACLQLGVSTIDCSIGGLGGCPYAPGAGGNVATEDVLYLLQGLNIDTGVNLDKLITAGQFIQQQLKRPTRSKVVTAMLANKKLSNNT